MSINLLIESGSTKADWIFFNSEGEIDRTESIGLNPKIIDQSKLESIIQSVLESHSEKSIGNVYFYGAGTLNKENIIQNAFSNNISSCQVDVFSDIEAAAHASSFKNKIVCILGTGSFIATFKKSKMISTRLGYGYIIGDICSGSEFGKLMIRDFLRGALPLKLEDEFQMKRSKTTTELYQSEFPNRYLASYFPLLIKHRKLDYSIDLIKKQIKLLNKHGFDKLDSEFNKITFVGGVANQLEKELQDFFGKKYEIEIIERPVDRLLNFYLSEM